MKIGRSFSPDRYTHESGIASGRPIRYGDRLFVRLTRMGKVVKEFMVTSVNDFSELIAEIHRNCRSFRGLVMLSVRNMLRGWSIERPLMLGAAAHPKRPVEDPAVETDLFSSSFGRMLMPWETH